MSNLVCMSVLLNERLVFEETHYSFFFLLVYAECLASSKCIKDIVKYSFIKYKSLYRVNSERQRIIEAKAENITVSFCILFRYETNVGSSYI